MYVIKTSPYSTVITQSHYSSSTVVLTVLIAVLNTTVVTSETVITILY